jgi:hypothetical protein
MMLPRASKSKEIEEFASLFALLIKVITSSHKTGIFYE